MIKKEDFVREFRPGYIKETYLMEFDDLYLVINEHYFDEDTINYAEKIINKFRSEKNNIMEFIINDIKDFYSQYDIDYIISHIGKPQIFIGMKKGERNPNMKVDYIGKIQFLEHNLDEHIIEIEFIDNLILNKRVDIDG